MKTELSTIDLNDFLPLPYKMKEQNYKPRLLESMSNIQHEFKLIIEEYERLRREQNYYQDYCNRWNLYGPKLVKMISNYILQGYNLDEALNIVAHQYQRHFSDVYEIWKQHASVNDICRNYAVKYLIFTLKIAGFTIADIARISHKGRSFVCKTLKEDFIL